MSETKQITKEELAEIQKVLNDYETVNFRIGQFTVEIETAKSQRAEMITQATALLSQREEKLKALEDKYGTGYQLNPTTGELVKNG